MARSLRDQSSLFPTEADSRLQAEGCERCRIEFDYKACTGRGGGLLAAVGRAKLDLTRAFARTFVSWLHQGP